MGMYTEFHYNTELKEDTPANVIDLLKFMVWDTDKEPEDLPEHELFLCGRWRFMLQCDSFYFDAATHSTLCKDRFGGTYLCIRCSLKNYEQEISKFCDWVKPYISKQEGGFLGFSRYEESEEPNIIYA